MADKKSVGHAYNVDFLNVIFAASSLLLFATTVWMVWDDYDREWKTYQRGFVQLETEVTRAGFEQAEQTMDRQRLDRLTAERAEAERQVAASQESIDGLRRELDDIELELSMADQEHQFTKSIYDSQRYEFEVRRENDPQGAEQQGREVEELYDRWAELGLEVEELTADRDRVRAEIATFTGQVTEIDDQIREMTGERTRLEDRLEDLAPSVVTGVLNAPLLDFMAPTLKIRQVITPDIVDDVNFIQVPKMDRCMTCHLAIDRQGYEEYPQPFRTHSNLDVYVGSGSPHPLEQTGCTVCHEGMGHSITFRDAAHSPADEVQLVRWEEEHGWEEPHLWDYPMLPRGMTEASCAKCHKEEIYVPEASALNTAYERYERAGCYACHKTAGFEELRKPGPNLTRIASKLTPEWAARWIRNPRAVKPSTWMPQAWYTSNSSAPEDAPRNEAEIDATVTYLFANSEEHQFAVPRPRRGDADNGERVVESVGCLACHIVGDETRTEVAPRRTFGQALQSIGDKTTFEWLFDWLRDSQHYSPDTYMPDLRLTDQEVADVATYLSGLTGPGGQEAGASYDQAFADEVLLDYLRSVMPMQEAQAMIEAMDPEERTLELGRRVIGRYGCFSCHEINGFEDERPIGVELSAEGSKLLPRLDFAFVDIPHTKISWFEQKLLDPRIYDGNRELQPLERLRMPDYGVSEEEARSLTTALMSFQSDIQPKASWVPRSARVDALITGRNLVRRRNCVACHVIEGDGGDYEALVEEPALAPPLLTPEGAKVQADWLYAFFKNPITIRPWLGVRMPTFAMDDKHWNEVLDYFAAISDAVGPFRSDEVTQVASRTRAGGELFEVLRCQSCHVLDTIPDDQSTDSLAPDLRMAFERLQPDWVLDWMRAPLEIQPGTRMPAYWPEYPSSDALFNLAGHPELDEDAVMQIQAVRDYMWTFRGGPSPTRAGQSASQD